MNMKEHIDAALEDRRFVMTIGAGVVDTLLVLLGTITNEQYVVLTLGTVGAYITAATWRSKPNEGQ